MLANDASQPAQQRDFEPARSLSWTHPRRNRAGAVIRASYDSLRASLYPPPPPPPLSPSIGLPFTLFFFPLFPLLPAPLRACMYVCIHNAVHLALPSQPSRSRLAARSILDGQKGECEIAFYMQRRRVPRWRTQLPTENWPPPYLRWRIYYRVATTGRHNRRLISVNDSPISSVIANSTTTAAARARA